MTTNLIHAQFRTIGSNQHDLDLSKGSLRAKRKLMVSQNNEEDA